MQLLNAAIGIALVSAAILHPVYVVGRQWATLTFAIGIAVCLLALASRKHTAELWQADVVLVLALALMFQGALRWLFPVPAVVDIWFVFWIGIFTSVLSLWALLYRPEQGGEAAPDTFGD